MIHIDENIGKSFLLMNHTIYTYDELKNNEKLAGMLKLLGHPDKLAIFKHLCNCGKERSRVKQIYSSLGMQQATASRHLIALKKHELLKRKVENGKVYYIPNLDNKSVKCISQCLTKMENKIIENGK